MLEAFFDKSHCAFERLDGKSAGETAKCSLVNCVVAAMVAEGGFTELQPSPDESDQANCELWPNFDAMYVSYGAPTELPASKPEERIA